MTQYNVEDRATQSQGTSGAAIYKMVRRELRDQHSCRGVIADVGCGRGSLWQYISSDFDRYIGVDVLRYDGLPEQCEFHTIDLDSGRASLPNDTADVVVGVETIEHLENPRAFARELVRICKPGGLIIITTPNQLSLLSKLTLLVKGQFNAFTDSSYPAHITALLEIDLIRIAQECEITDPTIRYSLSGRIPSTSTHWPKTISKFMPRTLSDNLLVIGRKSR
ncbi:class I SAM-dependent methyltransferase [Novipirellula sp. SH528]|uniref:class I SAM-dependent methyltransferase n=1 Tax=Novipirellula sp. SH528 TaxID=3454466 RepID=UPI003F9F8FA6